MGHHLEVNEVGVIGLTSIGQDYIDLCQLNRPTLVDFRRRVLRILKLLDQGISSELMNVALEYFQLPKELPDLSTSLQQAGLIVRKRSENRLQSASLNASSRSIDHPGKSL